MRKIVFHISLDILNSYFKGIPMTAPIGYIVKRYFAAFNSWGYAQMRKVIIHIAPSGLGN